MSVVAAGRFLASMKRFRSLLRRTEAFLHPFRSMSSYRKNPPGSELLMNCTNRRWLYNDDIRMCLDQDLLSGMLMIP
jgi:hypothetical protein